MRPFAQKLLNEHLLCNQFVRNNIKYPTKLGTVDVHQKATFLVRIIMSFVVGMSATDLSAGKSCVVEFLTMMRGIELCHLCKVLKDFIAMSH